MSLRALAKLAVVVVWAWTAPARADAPAERCARARADADAALAAQTYLDALQVAQVGRLWCDDFAFTAAGAIALAHLDDPARARDWLTPWLARDPAAATLVAWTFWRQGEREAFANAKPALEPGARARLDALASPSPASIERALADAPPRLAAARLALADLGRARQRRPWLAGALSTLVPGLGQAYAGSLESAAIAFVLNSLAIGATVELFRRDLPVTAALAGTVASMFYVGNIGSAVDLARRRNARAAAPAEAALARALLPEAYR